MVLTAGKKKKSWILYNLDKDFKILEFFAVAWFYVLEFKWLNHALRPQKVMEGLYLA